jgi:hypothetical protein
MLWGRISSISADSFQSDAAVLDSVHDDDLAVIVDLIDHSVVAASCRVQPGQLAD